MSKPRYHRAGYCARLIVVGTVALTSLASIASSSYPAAASTLSLEQWAAGYLAFLGAPASGPSDPRVEFLEKWATVEGTFYLGNVYNPLDTELPAPGAGLWNSAGVRTYPSLTEGYQATLETMQQAFDSPILAALRNRSSTLAGVTHALAASNWTGYGQLSSTETGYASVVGGAPAGPAGPQGPSSAEKAPGNSATTGSSTSQKGWGPTTAVIRGTVVDPLGHGLGNVCVSAVPDGGLAVSTLTSTNGSFRLAWVPEAEIRLRLTDCHFAEGGIAPTYFDATASRHRTSPAVARATVIDLRCRQHCGDVSYRVRTPIVYGMVTPSIAWPTPSAITYGAPVGTGQLDATSPVRGAFSYSPPAGTVLSAGTRSLTVNFTPRDRVDYRSTHATVVLNVLHATPQVSWNSPAPITYGTPLDGSELDASASVHGTFSYHWPASSGSVLGAGTQQLSATFAPSDSSDYSSVQVSTPLTVQQAVPTLSATPTTSALPGSLLTANELELRSSVAGSFVYSPPLGTALTVGTQSVTVTFTPINGIDYSGTSESVPLTAKQATPTVTWATPHAIAAGTTLSSSQLNAKASVTGAFTYSPPVGTMLAPGTQTLSATFTPTNSAAYTAVTSTTTVTVNSPTTPTITWSTPHSVTAGTALSSTQLDAHASVAGSFTYSPPLGTVLTGGTQTLAATFTPTNAAANASATTTVALVVTPAVPVLTWVGPHSVAAGTALSGTQLDATTPVAGTYTYNPPLGTVLSPGSHTLSVAFTPLDTVDYSPATATTTFVVAPLVVPAITWPAPTAVASGTALSATQLDATTSVAGTFSYSPALGTLLAVGSHVLSVTFTPTNSAAYSSASATVTLSVTGP